MAASLALASLITSAAPPAVSVAWGRGWPTQRVELNGVPVILVQDRQSTTFDLGVRVSAGYHDDPTGFDGLAHLAEHLIAHGEQPEFGESLGQWRGRDQTRSLSFHTGSDSTDFRLAADQDDRVELLRRFAAAMARSDYTTADVERQLVEIDGEEKPSRADLDTVLGHRFAAMADAGNPARRAYSSGEAKVLASKAVAQVRDAANELLRNRYPDRVASIVVVSSLEPAVVESLLRTHLHRLSRGAAEAVGAVREFIDPFSAASRSVSRIQHPGDETVLAVHLPIPHSIRRDTRLLDLIEAALGTSSGSALSRRLVATDYVTRATAEIVVGEKLPGADSLLIQCHLTARGRREPERFRALLQAAVVSELETRAAVIEGLAERRADRLLGTQPTRDALVSRLLQTQAMPGSDAQTLHYQMPVEKRDWDALARYAVFVARYRPVAVMAMPARAGRAERGRASSVAAPRAPALPSAAALERAAQCLAVHPDGSLDCLKPVWGMDAWRGSRPLLNGLQRDIARQLLAEAAASARKRNAGGRSIVNVVADTSPGIGIVGYGLDRKAAIDSIRAEFLRVRSGDELAAMLGALRRPAGQAYQMALREAREVLGFHDQQAVAAMRDVHVLGVQVRALQESYRTDAGVWFSSSPESARPQAETDAARREGTTIRAVASDSGVANYLRIRCGPATEAAMSALRLLMPEAHRWVWGRAQASGDPEAFGAFMVIQAADRLCFGTSEDSSVRNQSQLESSAVALERDIADRLCASDEAAWNDLTLSAQRTEELPWSIPQADAVRNLQNWMRGLDGVDAGRIRAGVSGVPHTSFCAGGLENVLGAGDVQSIRVMIERPAASD